MSTRAHGLRSAASAPLDAGDKRTLAIQAGLVAAALVVAGLALEALRNAGVLPWWADGYLDASNVRGVGFDPV